MLRRAAALAVTVAAFGGAFVAVVPDARAAVPTPRLSTPPAGLHGHPLWDSYYDLAAFGYEEQELFVSGTATDAAGATAPYTTRIIVTRPIDDADFNGTVLLDWVNVTAQFENAVDTMLARQMLMREGFAYVHASVQQAGLCCTPLTPQVWDPVRYAAISHPGDAYAFDILTQIAAAMRAQPGVERVLAAGQSQSGIKLAEYVGSWLPSHPDAVGVIDGILVHGNVPGEKAFAASSPVPVLQLLSDLEALDDGVDPASLGPNHRLWEIAGSSHADLFIGYQSIAGHGPRVGADAAPVDRAGFDAIIDRAGNYGEIDDEPLLAVCTAAGATFPMHYAASAAIFVLDRWVRGGPSAAPDSGPRFALSGGALARDADGNALGGIRLPPIDVPVARYESTACGLGGITIPFSDADLAARYGTGMRYYGLVAARTDRAVADGWLLPDDAVDLMRRACRAAAVRFTPTSGTYAPLSCATTPYRPPAFDEPLAFGRGPGWPQRPFRY